MHNSIISWTHFEIFIFWHHYLAFEQRKLPRVNFEFMQSLFHCYNEHFSGVVIKTLHRP